MKKFLALMLVLAVISAGCVQQASIVSTNDMPCSTLPECREFIKSTGMSDADANIAMERITCVNGHCSRR